MVLVSSIVRQIAFVKPPYRLRETHPQRIRNPERRLEVCAPTNNLHVAELARVKPGRHRAVADRFVFSSELTAHQPFERPDHSLPVEQDKTDRLRPELRSQKIGIAGNETLPSAVRNAIPRRLGRPLSQVQVACRSTEVRRAERVHYGLQPIEPAIRISMKVAVATLPDARDQLIRRVTECVYAKRSERFEASELTIELNTALLKLDLARIEAERRDP